MEDTLGALNIYTMTTFYGLNPYSNGTLSDF